MPVDSEILPESGLVITKATGTATIQEVRANQAALRADPAFDPSYHHLFDLSEVRSFQVSTGQIQELATRTLFSDSSRRAVIAPRDATFGLSRMYEGFSQLPEGLMKVFRDRKAALEWLGADGEEH